MYKLYIAKGACSLAAHIAIKELEIPHQIIKVDTKNNTYLDENKEQADYLKINSNGWVPVLQIGDNVLSEAGVILQYLAELKPSAGLFPHCDKLADFTKYKTKEWVSFISTEIHKSYSPLFNKNVDENTKTIYRQKLMERYAYINKSIKGEYLQGGNMTLPDIYLFVVSRWAFSMKVDITGFANLQKTLANVRARKHVEQVMKIEKLR